jgi:hypothetical protein
MRRTARQGDALVLDILRLSCLVCRRQLVPRVPSGVLLRALTGRANGSRPSTLSTTTTGTTTATATGQHHLLSPGDHLLGPPPAAVQVVEPVLGRQVPPPGGPLGALLVVPLQHVAAREAGAAAQAFVRSLARVWTAITSG